MQKTSKYKSKERAGVFLKAALEALNDAGGSLSWTDIRKAVASKVALTEHDLETYEKSGYVRWQSVLLFYSITAQKAGFIRKSDGKWQITDEGRAVLTLGPSALIDAARQKYKSWKLQQPQNTGLTADVDEEIDQDEAEHEVQSLVLENAISNARAEIENHIYALNPYQFQDLVAALLRGMSYVVDHIADPGPDGGTDIIAYPDALGAKTPHIRVQVKHRPNQKAGREDIAALRGIIRADREIGLFVSSGGFSGPAMNEARNGAVHIQLMDLDDLIDAWMNAYTNLSEKDRALLRLQPVYFLSPQ